MLIRLSGIAVLCIAMLLGSCNFNKKEDCILLDSKIAMTNDSLLQYGNHWGEELEISVNTLDFSGLRPIRLEMLAFIDRKLVEVKEMENVGKADELLKTELEFLAIEREIVTEKLAVFERFTDSVKMDQLSAAYAGMQRSAIKEQDMLEKLHKLRDDYAERNGIPKYIERY